MTDWIKCVSDLMGKSNQQWDSIKRQVNERLGIQDSICIMPYRGYGTSERIYLKGRLLEDDDITRRLEKDAALWQNLLSMYRRFETDEIPGVAIKAQVEDRVEQVLTDKEGFFEIDLELPAGKTDLWQPVRLEICTDKYPVVEKETQAEAVVVSDQARFGVISDIDDTVVRTSATNLLEMIRTAYMGNASTRDAFLGVADFYRALQQGGNPIFYVSSSPWNMYDLFERFMDLNDIPKGPILLRDIELSPANLLSFEHGSHKREQIEPILERFPELPLILIGDTGQKDAEIYRSLAEDYPDRILGIYLRNVTPEDCDRAQELSDMGLQLEHQGISWLVFGETAAAAAHAAERGWLAQSHSGVRC